MPSTNLSRRWRAFARLQGLLWVSLAGLSQALAGAGSGGPAGAGGGGGSPEPSVIALILFSLLPGAWFVYRARSARKALEAQG